MAKNPTPMSLGEKIKQVRQSKGLSQENLAHAVGKSKALISRLERGDSEFDNETLTAIKKSLGIEKAPLTERELEIYKERLWGWNEFVHTRRMDKAKDIQEDLKQILDLPFETELIMLYKLIDAKILLIEYNDTAVEEHLADVERYLEKYEKPSDEVLYLYHRAKGGLLTVVSAKTTHAPNSESAKERLNHFLLAHEYANKIQISDITLLAMIGNTYFFCARPIIAMRYLEQAKREYDMDKTLEFPTIVNSNLAGCYSMLGDYASATKLYETIIAEANRYNNHYLMGFALSSMGDINAQMGNLDAAMRYNEESFSFFDKTISQATEAFPESIALAHATKFLYVYALTQKASYLMKKNDPEGCKAALDKASDLATDDNEIMKMEVETTRHMNVKDDNSIEFLESVALPYFRNHGIRAITDALKICDYLESTYRKRGATNKANAIAAISRDIYKEMIFGPPDTQ